MSSIRHQVNSEISSISGDTDLSEFDSRKMRTLRQRAQLPSESIDQICRFQPDIESSSFSLSTSDVTGAQKEC